MTYVTRDRLGIYNGQAAETGLSGSNHGPGPELMGADTLIGDLVFNHKDEELGEIKEIDRKSTRLNSSHVSQSRMPSSA